MKIPSERDSLDGSRSGRPLSVLLIHPDGLGPVFAVDEMNSLECLGSESASNSLLVGINSLFWNTGNPLLPPRKRLGNSAPVPPAASSLGEFPCIFPVDQGIAPRDEFAPDSPHRHPGSGCRDFPLGSEDGSGKAREFAACWRLRSFDSEAETARCRGDSSRLARSSLSAISVVRFGAPVGLLASASKEGRNAPKEGRREFEQVPHSEVHSARVRCSIRD